MSTAAPAPPPSTAQHEPTPPQPPGPSPFKDFVKQQLRQAADPAAPPPTNNVPSPPPSTPTPTPAPAPAPQQKPSVEPAKPSTPAPDPEPEHFSHANANHWKAIKSDRDTWKTKASDYEKQIAEATERLKKFEGVNIDDYKVQIATITKERDGIFEILEREHMAANPRFQATYDIPMEAILTEAKTKEKGETLVGYLQMPEGPARTKALKEFAAEMDAFDQGDIAALARDYSKLRAERTARLAKSKEEMKMFREAEEKRHLEKQKEQQAIAEARIKEAIKAARKYESIKDGSNEESTLRKFFNGEGDWQSYADTMARGVDHPRIEKLVAERDAKIAELTASLEKLTKTNPSLRGAQPGAAPSGPIDFKQKVREFMHTKTS